MERLHFCNPCTDINNYLTSVIEHLLCARTCARDRVQGIEQNERAPCLPGAYGVLQETDIKGISPPQRGTYRV